MWLYEFCYQNFFDFCFIAYVIAKLDGHPHPTRNPMGSGVGAKFHPWVRVWV
jgi:hypothetical protein